MIRVNAAFIFLCAFSITALAQSPIDRSCNPLLLRNAPKPKAFLTKDSSSFSDSTIEWYSKHLLAMKEPSLLPPDNCALEMYRFLWLRTFHAPIAIRVWTTNGQHFLVAKQLSGKGGYEPGRIVVSRVKKLSNEEWNQLTKFFLELSFWNLPIEEPAIPNPDGSINVGMDGAQWILEGLRDGKYHIIDRWLAKDKYREACLHLLQLSNLRVRKSLIY